jgi:hypothetical protein
VIRPGLSATARRGAVPKATVAAVSHGLQPPEGGRPRPGEPMAGPTTDPTADPTAGPTADPTADPTIARTAEPTAEPRAEPATWPASGRGAEPTARTPPETPAETTAPLPAVPPQADQEHLTAGLPLLDLLAPQQTGHEQTGHEQTGHEQTESSRRAEQPQVTPGGPELYGMPLLAPGGADQYGPVAGSDLYAGAGGLSSPGAAPPPYRPMPPVRPRRRAGRQGIRLVMAVGAGVLLLAAAGIWALTSSPGRSNQPTRQGASSSVAPTSTPITAAGGYQFTQHAARSDTDCAANAYGKVAEFFRGAPCTRLDRRLFGTTVDGRLIVASVSVVQMPTEQAATDLRKLADTNGTGNVSDLLRVGVRVPGGPDSLTDAGYASARNGTTVVIAEADFADRAAHDESLLDKISRAALELPK